MNLLKFRVFKKGGGGAWVTLDEAAVLPHCATLKTGNWPKDEANTNRAHYMYTHVADEMSIGLFHLLMIPPY